MMDVHFYFLYRERILADLILQDTGHLQHFSKLLNILIYKGQPEHVASCKYVVKKKKRETHVYYFKNCLKFCLNLESNLISDFQKIKFKSTTQTAIRKIECSNSVQSEDALI